MKDLGKQVDAPTTIYEENQGAIELAKNAKYHSRTKHIDIRAVSNEIRVIYCRTEGNRHYDKGTTKTYF